ncbi:MAG TPA: MraY family glycosyltransferase [Thermoanaerobaculia bacterium]
MEAVIAITILFLASALTSFVATRIVKVAAEDIGLVDRPDERKHHEREIPRVGGLAIIFGFGFPLLLLAANSHAAGLVSKNLSFLFAMLASGSLIVGLGIYDDLVGADAPKKFIVQTAAAVILVSFGYQFTFVSLAGKVLQLGLLGAVISVIWIVGVINAVNFIDGMDSLATVVSITIAVAFAVIAIAREDAFSLVVMTALAGSLAGFYWWNKPPARIFMGDSGSMFIGLLLAAGSIAKPSKSPALIIITGPIIALALPVLDTLFVMKQRLGGSSTPLSQRLGRLFNADRRHIHHILLVRFGSERKAIVSIWLVTLLFATAAVMTAIDVTKTIGYSAGILGLIAMIALRWERQRHGQTSTRNAD